jgi:predicted MFS family arabinose efflux permease
MTGNAVGVMLLVPLIQVIIDGPGWRWAWLLIGGGSGLILAVASALLLRRRPEDLGLLPDGEPRPPPTSAVAPPLTPTEAVWTVRRAARSSAFWLLVLASCGSQVAISGLTTNQAPLLIDNGLSPAAVAGAIGLYGFSWTTGTLVWGLIVERFSARIVLAATSLLVSVCCVGVLFVRDPTALVLFALSYGLSNGAKEALDAIVWADYFGRRSVGAIRGLSRPFVVGSSALGSFLGGLGYDLTGGYTAVVLLFAVLALCGCGVSLAASPPRDRVGAAI